MTVPNLTIIKAVQEHNMPDSVVALNIFYFEADFVEPQTEEDVVDAIEMWLEGLYNNILSAVSDEVTLGECTVYVWESVSFEWENIGTCSPSKVFTGETEMLPHGVAALIRAYSANTKSIARKYIPGFTVGGILDGAWTAANLSVMADYADSWVTAETISANNDLIPSVFDTKIFAAHALTGVTVVLADPGYQRRRRPGVGM